MNGKGFCPFPALLFRSLFLLFRLSVLLPTLEWPLVARSGRLEST
jgi:hypothetical protein